VAGKARARFAGAGSFVVLALARGAAVFFGLMSLANGLASLRTANPSQDIWWIDTRFLPGAQSAAFAIGCAVVLVGYGILPRMAPWRRVATVVVCAALCAVALQNVTTFYRLWGAGAFSPGFIVPFSLLVALLFGLIGWGAWAIRPGRKPGWPAAAGAVVAALLMAALFPLAQMAFFGMSDYRAKADAAVIFGAKANADWSLSPSLSERVGTGVELYKEGLVRKLVMSGAVGDSGVDEPSAMRRAAIKAGVPATAIELDHKGFDTDGTVVQTTALFAGSGVKRVLVVSQPYHLPRVKLAYLAAGWDVRTVPAAPGPEPIPSTPMFIAREVPAFWVYWLRALALDVARGS
jgi:vancomycin permeability regulator SanA